MWVLLRHTGTVDERSAAPAATSSTPERPIAIDAAPAPAQESVAATRNPLPSDSPGRRALELALVRYPDERPVANIPLEIEPRLEAVAGAWLATSDDGRVKVEVPSDARSVRVRAEGFEPLEAALGAGRELSLVLMPSSGLFGRVLRPDGT